MIIIKTNLKNHGLDLQLLEKQAQFILQELGYADFDLGIWLTTNKTIKEYNKTYRKKDVATDILSFPYHADIKAGQKIKVESEEDKNVGDIIISVEFVRYLLPLYTTTLQNRMGVLLIHGICHLLGYTHYDEDNDEKMSAIERNIAKKLQLPTDQ
jgi:rRNA maturation RNase YbeY